MIGLLLTIIPHTGFSVSRDSLHTDYHHGLNTESWEGGFVYQKSFFSHYQLRMYESFLSSRLRVPPADDKWKDRQSLLMEFSRRLTDKISMSLLGSGLVFSDKQSGYQNDMRTHLLGIGAAYTGTKVHVPVFIGMKDDRRFEQTDRGVNYRIGIGLPQFNLAEYHNRLQADYEADDLNRRKNNSLSISYFVHRQFYAETSDSLRLNLSRRRRDYYVSDSGIIESRDENSQEAENLLTYGIGEGMLCTFKGAISSRRLKISLMNGPQKGLRRERRDFNLSGIVRFRMIRSSFRGDVSFGYIGGEQKYAYTEEVTPSPYPTTYFLSTPDNRNTYTTLSMQVEWRFLPNDSLYFASHLQRFRYDTPDSENFDDRDELRFWLDIHEIHRFSPELSLKTALHLNLHHFVYIFGEKSADNNWTRILRASSTIRWHPSPYFRLSQSAEVLANYVEYDFESYFSSVRSFLYRKFRFEDSTWVAFTSRTSLRLTYRLELDENGKLIWDRWLEQKLLDRCSHTLTLSLDHRPWRGFQITPGYTFFSRQGYRYDRGTATSQKKVRTQYFQSHGPFMEIVYVSDRLRFVVDAGTVATKTLHADKQIYTRIEFKMNWTF